MDGLFGTGIKFHRGASNLRRGFREIYDHFLHPAEGGWYLLCLRLGLILLLFNLFSHFHTNVLRGINWFGQSTVDN